MEIDDHTGLANALCRHRPKLVAARHRSSYAILKIIAAFLLHRDGVRHTAWVRTSFLCCHNSRGAKINRRLENTLLGSNNLLIAYRLAQIPPDMDFLGWDGSGHRQPVIPGHVAKAKSSRTGDTILITTTEAPPAVQEQTLQI